MTTPSVDTIQAQLVCLKEFMDERDRRYEENRRCDQEAVKLAKEVADKARGTVGISLLIGVMALLMAVVREFR